MVAPGLSVRTDPVEDPDVDVEDLEWTGPRLHRQVFDTDVMRSALLEAVEDVVAGLDEQRARRALAGLGVDALEGTFATLAVRTLAGDERARWKWLRLAREVGTGQTSLGVSSTRDDLEGGPASIFAAADVSPQIQVRLTGAFFDRRAQHRREVLDVLLALSRGCSVELVLTPYARRLLWERHRERLPADVTDTIDPPLSQPPANAETLESLVEAASERIDPTSTRAAVLAELHDRPSQAASYREIRSSLLLDAGHVRKLAERLEDLGVVERLSSTTSSTRLSLTQAGSEWVSRTISDGRLKRRHGGSTGGLRSDGVTPPPKISPDSRVSRASTGDPPDPEAEAAAATAETPADRRAEGRAPIDSVPYADRAAAVAGVDDGEVCLVDAPAREIDDPRTALWSYDETADELVVGCRATRSVLQQWTTLARALSSRLTFDVVLEEDRLQDVLDEVPRVVLERVRQIGGLSKGRADDAARLRDYYLRWTERLCDETRRYRQERDDLDDREDREWRGEIVQQAKGLSGSLAHLLDLADVGLTRLLYADDAGKRFADDDASEALARSVAHQAAIESHYEGRPAYRLLYEDRDEHRDFAIDADLSRDPEPQGELFGSFLLVGQGVDVVEEDLRRFLEAPRRTHDDAPEVEIPIPVRTEGVPSDDPLEQLVTRGAVERTAAAVLDDKLLEVTDRAVSLLHQWLGTSLDVSRALSQLSTENFRAVRSDEVRFALSTLDERRLIPGLPRSAQAGLSVLLEADERLSQAELCRRADISTESWRSHRDTLRAGRLVDVDGDGWRVTLPRPSERDDVDDVLPVPVVDEGGIAGTYLDVLADVAADLFGDRVHDVDDPLSSVSTWPPDPAPLVDEDDQLVPGLRAARAVAGGPDGPPRPVRMGRPVGGRQSGISRYTGR